MREIEKFKWVGKKEKKKMPFKEIVDVVGLHGKEKAG